MDSAAVAVAADLVVAVAVAVGLVTAMTVSG